MSGEITTLLISLLASCVSSQERNNFFKSLNLRPLPLCNVSLTNLVDNKYCIVSSTFAVLYKTNLSKVNTQKQFNAGQKLILLANKLQIVKADVEVRFSIKEANNLYCREISSMNNCQSSIQPCLSPALSGVLRICWLYALQRKTPFLPLQKKRKEIEVPCTRH